METLLVRLKRHDSRRGNVLRRYTYAGIKFHEERGWYRVAKDVADYLRADPAARTGIVVLQLLICIGHLAIVKVQEARARVVPQEGGPDQVSAGRRRAVVTQRRLAPYMPYSRFGRLRVVDRSTTAMKDPQRRAVPKPRVAARRQRPRAHPHESRTS